MNSNISDVKVNIEGLSQLIKDCLPDVIFVSELSDENRKRLGDLLGKDYEYTIFEDGVPHSFYSRYKLTEWEILENSSIKGACRCSIEINERAISLYGCHFASNNYSIDNEYYTPGRINGLGGLKKYLRNIKLACRQRAVEAQNLRSVVERDSHSMIVMGDFNDVSGSKTMSLIEDAGLMDAWWNLGRGYGATIHYPLPFRIDHILYSGGIKLRDVNVIRTKDLSDHDAIMAEFVI